MSVALTCGTIVLVDPEDVTRVSAHRWHLTTTKAGHRYAITSINGRTVYMHRFIMDVHDRRVVDHRNRNGLDNQKSNLRVCTQSQNLANGIAKPKRGHIKSEYKGVYWDKERRIWYSKARLNYKQYFLGRFRSEDEAARAYDLKANELYGEFARYNFPEEWI